MSTWLLLTVINSYLTSISLTCLYNNLFAASVRLASEIFPDGSRSFRLSRGVTTRTLHGTGRLSPKSESNAEIQYRAIAQMGNSRCREKIVIVYEANSQTERISTISTVLSIFPISLSGEFQTKNQNEGQRMNDNKQRVLHAAVPHTSVSEKKN